MDRKVHAKNSCRTKAHPKSILQKLQCPLLKHLLFEKEQYITSFLLHFAVCTQPITLLFESSLDPQFHTQTSRHVAVTNKIFHFIIRNFQVGPFYLPCELINPFCLVNSPNRPKSPMFVFVIVFYCVLK